MPVRQAVVDAADAGRMRPDALLGLVVHGLNYEVLVERFERKIDALRVLHIVSVSANDLIAGLAPEPLAARDRGRGPPIRTSRATRRETQCRS